MNDESNFDFVNSGANENDIEHMFKNVPILFPHQFALAHDKTSGIVNFIGIVMKDSMGKEMKFGMEAQTFMEWTHQVFKHISGTLKSVQ